MSDARKVHGPVDADGVAACGRFKVVDWKARPRLWRRRFTSAVTCVWCKRAHRAAEAASKQPARTVARNRGVLTEAA